VFDNATDHAIRLAFENQKPGFLLALSKKLDRGEHAIKRRAAELGIVIVPLRSKTWTQEEDKLLAAGAEQGMTLTGLAALLKRNGFTRSSPAIRSRLFRIEVALSHDSEATGQYYVTQLAILFGVNWATVKKWISRLGLPAEQKGDHAGWQVRRRDLRLWVMENLAAINFHTLDKFWFASLLFDTGIKRHVPRNLNSRRSS
jgi:hypothetical protein